MKLKFTTVFRIGLIVFAVLLVWAMWANAQGTVAPPSTNAALGRSLANKASMLFNDQGELTFGLHRLAILGREAPDGTPLWRYLASLIYILLALAASKFLDYLAHAYLKRWVDRTKTKFDDVIMTLIEGPIKVICFVVLLHIGLQVYNWPKWAEDFVSKGLVIGVAFSLTYMITKFVDLFMGYWRQRASVDTDKTFDEVLFPLISKTLKVFIVAVAALLTAQNLGVNITSLLASLSIGGLAVGLGAQDTLANMFGAVSVLVDKPFRIGDRIKLDSIDGTVETIGLRSTRVRSLDGYLITVPNKTIGNAVITNITRRPTIKTEMNIGVTYDTPLEKLKRAVEILKEVYGSHPKTSDLVVSFNKFADSALNIAVVHWWNSTDQKEYLQGMQELHFQVKRRFDGEGINFAFPSQTIYLKHETESQVTASVTPGRMREST